MTALVGIGHRLLLKFSVCALFLWPLLSPLDSLGVASEKRMRALSREEVASTWVGLSEDELYLVRLSLDGTGEGIAGYVFGEEEPRIFKIRAWTYDGEAINIPLESIGESALETPTLSGEMIGASMKLTMRGSGWNRKVELRLEEPLERRWGALRSEMARPGR